MIWNQEIKEVGSGVIIVMGRACWVPVPFCEGSVVELDELVGVDCEAVVDCVEVSSHGSGFGRSDV